MTNFLISLLISTAHADPISIPLPAGFATSVAAQASQNISDWQTLIYLIAGVLLVAVLIDILIGALRK
jgi:hypothetical protein